TTAVSFRLSEAAEAWTGARDTTDPAVLEAFIVRFNDNIYGDLARNRLDELRSHTVANQDPVRQPASATPCDGIKTQVGSEQRCVRANDKFKDCADCPEMVVVQAGRFMMGSPTNEKHRESNESPQHEVTIGSPFAVGRVAVTRGEFSAFARETNHAVGE